MGSFKKPLLIYDGTCEFCKRWILLWKEMTGSAVEYHSSQQVGKNFPKIPSEKFETSIVLVLPSGDVYYGAEAVLRTLVSASPRYFWASRALACYEGVPAFSALLEFFYMRVARNRVFFSKVTRLLFGERLRRPTYFLTRWIFLKGLSLVYLAAFVSLGSQLQGLVGSSGILISEWSDLSIQLLWISGAVGSGFLFLGFAPFPLGVGVWIAYYYLAQICQIFLGFQWDSLMLEMGFLALFFVPFSLRRGRGPWGFKFRPNFDQEVAPSLTPVFLLRWLLFRVVFFSGWVKLASGDSNWRNLTALTYHFETQPLPIFISWYAHQMPIWVHQFLAFCLIVVELGAPLLIFLPRRPRTLAFCAIVGLQVCINLTGNYGFFGWQIVCLCLVLLDDSAYLKIFPLRWTRRASRWSSNSGESKFKRWISYGVATLILLITILHVDAWVGGIPLNRVINQYGVFAVMTTQRDEIIIEGSDDNQKWIPYEFKYKPGDLTRPPSFLTLHMPRLDWQMWFAALSSFDNSPWMAGLMLRLLEGSPSVLSLMGQNPFENQPPRYIRALRYRYTYADSVVRREHGSWWVRELIGAYSPILTLK